MKITKATLFSLRIPFTETFSHSVKSRTYSDSIVVKIESEDGTIGYGEAVAREYVTGETVSSCLKFMAEEIFPVISKIDYPLFDSSLEPITYLTNISKTIPSTKIDGIIAPNAAKTGFELAIIDCLLKSKNLSLANILLPKRNSVIYSGVITSASIEKAVKNAKYFKLFGLQHIKIKTTGEGDYSRIQAIRKALGNQVSLRIDGNGIYDVASAITAFEELAELQIDSVEQPIPRCQPEILAELKAKSVIPIMVDESLVTLEDAKALIANNACDFFNLRISKCGGIAQTLEIAELARVSGIKLQLGCQVGETAILSAAGRHLAAYLDNVVFVEGSYGKLLLTEDISTESIHFGNGGKANLLRKPGLGIEVKDSILQKYGYKIIEI